MRQQGSLITFFFGLGCVLPVFAQSNFGAGDEQQQFQQMQQLQRSSGISPARSNSPAPISPALVASTTSMQPEQTVSSNNPFAANPISASEGNAMMTAVALSGAASNAADPSAEALSTYPTFTPYTGPSNRLESASPAEQVLNDAAFNGAVTSVFPMTTDQIHQMKQVYSASQAAAAASPGIPPRPTVTSQIVSIAPGSTPPVIRLAQGFVSSLVFVDSTGAPWPIEAYDIGNPGAFSIQWNHTDNTLMIQSITLYTYGNLAVRLKNLSTPVMLTLIPGQRAIDYRVDLRIQGIGPNAKMSSSMGGIPNSANPDLLGVLDGVPPRGAKNMLVTGGEAQAWLSQGRLFLRTRLTVLSPAWIATMSSADGMNAYELQKTPMILASFHGKPIQLRVEGF